MANVRGHGEWKDKSKVQCYNCKDFRHFAYECPEKKKNETALLAIASGDYESVLL